MQTLSKIIKPIRNSTLTFLRHTSTLSPPQQPPNPTTAATTTSAYYDEQIYEAGQSQNFRRLHSLLIRRINDGCLNTNDTFRFITTSPSAVKMLGNLLDCLATLPEGSPRKNAFDALVRRLCKIRLTDNALQVLDQMRERNLEITSHSFRPILEAVMRKPDVEKAVGLIKAMKEFGVAADASYYNVVLKEYCMKGDVIHAVNLLRKMVHEEGLKGDAWTYNAMVLMACKTGKVEGALAVVRAALDDGVKPLHITYERVIGALLEDGFYEQAIKLVRLVAGVDKRLDNEIFDFLAVGLILRKRFDEAKMVIDEMIAKGLVLRQKLRDVACSHDIQIEVSA